MAQCPYKKSRQARLLPIREPSSNSAMNFDRLFTAGLLLGLFTGIVAFTYGTRTARTTLDLAPQSLPEHQLYSAGQHSELTLLPAVPSTGLRIGP
jgi:hypothetical protein